MNIQNIIYNAFLDELQKIAQTDTTGVEDMSNKSLYTTEDYAKFDSKHSGKKNNVSFMPKIQINKSHSPKVGMYGFKHHSVNP